jgi:hypothetical protein
MANKAQAQRKYRYFLGDGTILRSDASLSYVWLEIYRGEGRWEPYPMPETFYTNSEEVDPQRIATEIAEFDKARAAPV